MKEYFVYAVERTKDKELITHPMETKALTPLGAIQNVVNSIASLNKIGGVLTDNIIMIYTSQKTTQK